MSEIDPENLLIQGIHPKEGSFTQGRVFGCGVLVILIAIIILAGLEMENEDAKPTPDYTYMTSVALTSTAIFNTNATISAGGQPSTPTDGLLTATAVIAGATATQMAIDAIAVGGQPTTVTPLLHTYIPSTTPTDGPSPTLFSAQITASAVIAAATATQAAIDTLAAGGQPATATPLLHTYTPSTTPTDGPSPTLFSGQMTASAVISAATATQRALDTKQPDIQ